MKWPAGNAPIYSVLIGLLLLILFSSSNYRATFMSMTHDESSTYLNYADKNIWDCLSDRNCFGTANNHLLNTIAFQQTISWFGLSEWSIRLPNVFMHLLYLLSSWYLVRLLVPGDGRLQLTGFALLNLNPYLLDFFVVARGYGMAMGFIMIAITSLFAYLQQRNQVWIWSLFGFSFFAVISVFTSLIFWFAAWGTLLIIQLYWLSQKTINWKVLIKGQLIPLTFTIVLSFLLFRPIQWLYEGGEFLWGANSIYDTYYYLIVDSLYLLEYIGNDFTNKLIFQIVVLFFMLSGLYLTYSKIKEKKEPQTRDYFIIASALLLLPVVIVLLQNLILGSLFIVGRKSLLFIPIAGILTLLVLQHNLIKEKRWSKWLLISVFAFSILHYIRSFNPYSCREWWYDSETKNVAEFFNQQTAKDKSIRIASNWLFHPTLEFYRKTMVENPWKTIKYSKTLEKDPSYDYYYILKTDYDSLRQHFKPVDSLGCCFYILENVKNDH